jgi:outer membrane efflux protein
LLAKLRTLHDEARAARSELDSLNQSADLAAESLRLTTLRYQSGEATVLEVVDAQNTATLTRNAFSEGQSRFRGAGESADADRELLSMKIINLQTHGTVESCALPPRWCCFAAAPQDRPGYSSLSFLAELLQTVPRRAGFRFYQIQSQSLRVRSPHAHPAYGLVRRQG